MGDYLHRTTKQLYISTSPNELAEQIANYIEDPDLSSVVGVPSIYWNIVGDVVSEMNQTEKDAVDAAATSNRRDLEMQEYIDNLESALRQLVVLIVDEINILRKWDVDFQAAVASSSNLSQLKTEVAALPSLSERTFQQLKTQIRNALGT